MILCTLASVAVLGIVLLLRERLGLLPEQPCYLAILPVRLIHYYCDHVLFRHPEALIAEAAPA
jgi:hypothetical protein